MEISLFADLKSTWEIVGFDEEISEIPRYSSRKRLCGLNPLDEYVAICFSYGWQDYVYYLPKTEQIRTMDMLHLGNLSKEFGTNVRDTFLVKGGQKSCTRPFLYEMVIGEYLVYRRFEVTVECRKIAENEYAGRVSPIRETHRYVFHSGGLVIENRDHTKTIASIGQLAAEDAYDTIQDANIDHQRMLFRNFVHHVKLSYKNEIIHALSHTKEGYPKFCLKGFAEIFSKTVGRKGIPAKTPQRILRELHSRSHSPNTTLRIEKDLVVVVGERSCKYIDCREQTRAYFDSKNAYYFVRNAITGEWEEDDFSGKVVQSDEARYRMMDRDAFDNTCLEKFTDYSIAKWIPRDKKVKWGPLLVQSEFLSAEQAAKIRSPVFNVILQSIYEGRLTDHSKSLSELLGISGAQIKFLEGIQMPRDLEKFAACMQAEDFKEHFPDVKKRIFAVSFFLEEYDRYSNSPGPTKEEVFASAQTLNSLERCEEERREYLQREYWDYLKMRRRYQNYLDVMLPENPIRVEVLRFGEMPFNMKPSRIKDYHNKIAHILSILDHANKYSVYTAALEERYAKEAKTTEYTNGTYSMVMPKNVEDIIREGRELHHCVGHAGYIEAMASNRCTILFLRENRAIDTPLITIEVRDGSIRQCYGIHDSFNNNPKIRDFVKEYAALHNLKIKAVIYKEAI